MRTLTIVIACLILIMSCNQKTENTSESSHHNVSKHIETVDSESELVDEVGPPFSDTCLSSFDYIGNIRVDENRFDLILSGKNWNPEYYSCTYTWGELINNEFPPDTLVKDFRIHLIEVDSLPNDLDSTFFETEIFKTKLIATYSKGKNEEYMTCKFDPNKTGKYSKPKQWVE